MSPYACPCQATGSLCDDCLHEQLSWFKGLAQLRGESWARAVANVCPIDRPWPLTEKMRAGARRKVESITSDARLLELLADEVTTGAARWWNRMYLKSGVR